MKIIVLALLVFCSSIVNAQELILTRNSIGPLSLKEGDLISVDLIKKIFPEYDVSHEIRSWEGPDFHSILVSKRNGDIVLSISSYINDKNYEREKNAKEYTIDEIGLGTGLKDEYGIKVGDKLEKVFRIRGKNLNLISNHFNNTVGKDKIYYVFEIKPTPAEIKAQHGVNYRNPESVTIEEAIKKNPEIQDIVWNRILK